MSTRHKIYSGAEAVEKIGYLYTLAVPMHKELGVNLSRKLLQQAQLSAEEFDDL